MGKLGLSGGVAGRGGIGQQDHRQQGYGQMKQNEGDDDFFESWDGPATAGSSAPGSAAVGAGAGAAGGKQGKGKEGKKDGWEEDEWKDF